MLGVVSHIGSRPAGRRCRWRTLAEVRQHPEVVGGAVHGGAGAAGARRGHEGAWCAASTRAGTPGSPTWRPPGRTLLAAGARQFGVVLGGDWRALGVRRGDVVTLIAPSGQVTPAGVVPRLKQMTVVGIFGSGHYEYDSALALLHIEDDARASSAWKAHRHPR